MGILEKVRPNLPVKPLPTKKPSSSENKEDKTVRGTKAVANSKTIVKPKVRYIIKNFIFILIFSDVQFRRKRQPNHQAVKRKRISTRHLY